MRNNLYQRIFKPWLPLDLELVFISFWAIWPNLFSSLQACINFLVPVLYSLHFFRNGHFISVWSLIILKVQWVLIFQLPGISTIFHEMTCTCVALCKILKNGISQETSLCWSCVNLISGAFHYVNSLLFGGMYILQCINYLKFVCLCAMEIWSGLFERWITSVCPLITLLGATPRYFELLWPSTKLPLNWRKPENNTLERKENTKVIINHKGTRMEKIENLGSNFQTV